MLYDDTINVVLCLWVMFSVLMVLIGLRGLIWTRITKNDRCLTVRNLDIVVETRQGFYEHVGTFVGELVTTRREEVQCLVKVKVEMSATTYVQCNFVRLNV